MKWCFPLFIILLFTSCSFLNKRGTWGKRAIYPVSGSNVLNALKKNVSSPHVWIPLAGAGTIFLGGWDDNISNWAHSQEGIFEKENDADNWSDTFNEILKYETYLTTLLTPSMNEDGKFSGYLWNKAKGAFVVNAAGLAVVYTHDTTRDWVKRERPDESDLRSFPSGHAMAAGGWNTLTNKNLDYIEMKKGTRSGIKTVNTTIAAGTLWSRIEGQRHYPTDVLCGYAMASFISGFIYDAFMNADPNETLIIAPTGKGEVVGQYIFAF